ncbi:MAG: hypothetical protein ACOX6A_05245 [Atribacter sp.]|uniref:hypothetical protein n=1 Tax=Atribacter sp. TaxID=2847780 RepID=UPI003D969644
MKKVNVEVNKIGYPMPVVIIGTEAQGKSKFYDGGLGYKCQFGTSYVSNLFKQGSPYIKSYSRK